MPENKKLSIFGVRCFRYVFERKRESRVVCAVRAVRLCRLFWVGTSTRGRHVSFTQGRRGGGAAATAGRGAEGPRSVVVAADSYHTVTTQLPHSYHTVTTQLPHAKTNEFAVPAKKRGINSKDSLFFQRELLKCPVFTSGNCVVTVW